MKISEENLRKHVRYLTSTELQGREFKSEGDRMAAQYIQKNFQEYGLESPVQFPDYIQKLPQGGQNVFGILRGNDADLAEECVIIDAHHDHMGNGFCGASDNAAGVAILLELARIFASNKNNKRSLLFACFDSEEQIITINKKEQMMYGASYYLENPVFETKKTAAMLTLDTLGRNDLQDNLIFLLGSERSLLIQDTIYKCSTDLRKIMFGVELLTGVKGNYIPFIDKKIPSLFISNGIHRDYHTKEDTSDKLNYELVVKDTKFISEIFSAIANSNEKPDFCRNPICPKTEIDDILYLLKLLQELIRQSDGNAEQFNYIIEKLESKPSRKELKQAVQIILGFMTPNFARFYLLLNDAQMAEKRKEYSIALQRYREILDLNNTYRVPYVWMQGIEEKISMLEEKVR